MSDILLYLADSIKKQDKQLKNIKKALGEIKKLPKHAKDLKPN